MELTLDEPRVTANAGGQAGTPRIALVGCGTTGNRHLDRLLLEKVDVVAACDPDSDSLARVAGRLPRRPRLFRSEQDLLSAGLVDAVVVCTPHERHFEQVRAAIDAGVHVLCERPFVVGEKNATDLVRASREKAVALFVSYALRAHGHVLFLLGATGRIGPLRRVEMTFGGPWLQRYGRSWRMRSILGGGGYVHDTGSAILDLLLYLVDSPVAEVDAVLERDGFDVDIRASLRIEFRNGVRANVTLVGDSTEHLERVQLFGDNGTAGWSAREDSQPELYVRPNGGISVTGDPLSHGMSPDAAFLSALRSGRGFGADTSRDLYDAATAVPVVALLERIYADAVWR